MLRLLDADRLHSPVRLLIASPPLHLLRHLLVLGLMTFPFLRGMVFEIGTTYNILIFNVCR